MKRLFFISLFLLAGTSNAATLEFTIVIHDHKFEPAELIIPADTRVKLLIDNQDPTSEEFESYELGREKIIPGNSTGSVYIGPLKTGRYTFFGEFNQDTAKGVVIAQ